MLHDAQPLQIFGTRVVRRQRGEFSPELLRFTEPHSDFDVGDYIDVLVDGAWKPARWTCTTWKWCHHVNFLAEDGSEIVTDTVLDGKTPARKRRR